MKIGIEEAAKLINAGEVVAIPTETVYGLAALMRNEKGIKEIYRLKNRPPQNPLIMHISDAKEVGNYVEIFPEGFEKLAEAFWPGPLTLVIKIKEQTVPGIVRAGLPTQSFRVPAHPLARALIQKTGPLIAPSANQSGFPSSTSEEHVEADFGKSFPVLSGGVCLNGVESTILVYNGSLWQAGRLGAIPLESFQNALGYIPSIISKDDPLVCPGQKYRHYAPKAKLNLASFFPEDSVIIGFSDRSYPSRHLLELGSSQDPEMALSRLYEILRSLDKKGISEAYVDMDFPDHGLFATLKERLIKACG